MIKRIFAITFMFTILSCSLLEKSEYSNISIIASLNRSSISVKSVELTVSADNMATISQKSSTNSIEVSVPRGKDRKFALKVTLNSDEVLYGEAVEDITSSTATISIVLKSLTNGELDILVGEFSVSSTDLGLGIDRSITFGESITLTSTGNIENSVPQWFINGKLLPEKSNTLILDYSYLNVGSYEILYRVYNNGAFDQDKVGIIVNPVSLVPVVGDLVHFQEELHFSTLWQIAIQWTRSTDNNTAQGNLEYKVVLDADSYYLSEPLLADSQDRIVLSDWQEDSKYSEFSPTTLELLYQNTPVDYKDSNLPATYIAPGNYYVTVLVRDKDSNMIIYPEQMITINVP